MMLTAEPTETAFRYRRNVQPAVVLPFDGVSTPYTIGSRDTNGYLFLVGYHDKTICMGINCSVSDGRGFRGVYPLCAVSVPEKLRFPG